MGRAGENPGLPDSADRLGIDAHPHQDVGEVVVGELDDVARDGFGGLPVVLGRTHRIEQLQPPLLGLSGLGPQVPEDVGGGLVGLVDEEADNLEVGAIADQRSTQQPTGDPLDDLLSIPEVRVHRAAARRLHLLAQEVDDPLVVALLLVCDVGEQVGGCVVWLVCSPRRKGLTGGDFACGGGAQDALAIEFGVSQREKQFARTETVEFRLLGRLDAGPEVVCVHTVVSEWAAISVGDEERRSRFGGTVTNADTRPNDAYTPGGVNRHPAV